MCAFISAKLLFRNKVVKKLGDMFPGLCSKRNKQYPICMLPILLRRDAGTYDCLRKSYLMEKKVDTTLFPVRTEDELTDWAWVCGEIRFYNRIVKLRLSQPRDWRGQKYRTGTLKMRRTQEMHELARKEQDYVFDERLNKKKKKKNKKKKQQKKEEIPDFLARWDGTPKRSRKRSKRMIDSEEQGKTLVFEEPPKKRRRKK